LIAGQFRSLREDLELPLALHHLGVDPFDVQPGLKAQLHVLFDQCSADRFAGTNAAIIRPLRCRVTGGGKAHRLLSLGVPQGVFLFETEPKIIVVFIDRGTTVGTMRRAVSIQDFAHYQEAVSAQAIGVVADKNGLEHQIGTPTGCLLGTRTVEAPVLGVFDLTAEVAYDLGFAAKGLRRLITIQPDVL